MSQRRHDQQARQRDLFVTGPFDGPAQLHRDPEPTEVEAVAKIAPSVSRLRRQVYEAVKSSPKGLAGFEACAIFPDVNPYSIRPRLTELGHRGMLEKRGKRENANGNNEMVWHATDRTWSDAKPVVDPGQARIATLEADLKEARGFVRLIRDRSRLEADDLAERWWANSQYISLRDLEAAADAFLTRTENRHGD